MGEAIRIPGAVHIWFSHNHPSGSAELSRADLHLNQSLSDVFRGSGIEPMELLAIGRTKFAFDSPDPNGQELAGQQIPDSTSKITVPAIERELRPDGSVGQNVSSPQHAKDIGRVFYNQSGQPGRSPRAPSRNPVQGAIRTRRSKVSIETIARTSGQSCRGIRFGHGIWKVRGVDRQNGAQPAPGGDSDP